MKVDWVRLVPRLLDDRDRLLNGATLDWAVVVPEIWFSLGWHGGGYPLLGFLVDKWASGEFVERCPYCGSDAYLLTARTYRLVNGQGEFSAVCMTCRKIVLGQSHLWFLAKTRGFRDNVVKSVRYRPGIKLIGNWDSFRKRYPYVKITPNMEFVYEAPSWIDFMRSHFADCLLDGGADDS